MTVTDRGVTATAAEGETTPPPQAFPVLRVSSVSKSFHGQRAVDDVSFDVHAGELFTLLGPSGCGKTTTLRQVAGLEQPDGGEIWYRGEIVAAPEKRIAIPPEKRQMGMVFQSYAIWPHLSVFENVAYPLRVRRTKKAEIAERVDNALDLIGMTAFAKRAASALSGGQQQRVALARALVYEPDLLLLDEPFSNLDAKLREQMCIELKLLQQRLNVAVVMVTHDQSEALGLSDRIAVLDKGILQQVATPAELYDRPASSFVRDFVGETVTVDATVTDVTPDGVLLTVPSWNTEVLAGGHRSGDVTVGDAVQAAIRPESFQVQEASVGRNLVGGVVEALLFEGDRYSAQVRAGDRLLSIHLERSRRWAPGDQLSLAVLPPAVGVWA